jgi:hypothetical protein
METKCFKQEYRQGMRFVTFIESDAGSKYIVHNEEDMDSRRRIAAIAESENAGVGLTYTIDESGALSL